MQKLKELSKHIKKINVIGRKVAKLTNRPFSIWHTGEYIASEIFCIDLTKSANQKGYDGRFRDGKLKGKTVNIKWYPILENAIDINSKKDGRPDFYLVLTGPQSQANISQGQVRPWVIERVFLFDTQRLLEELKVKHLGYATSVRKKFWLQAEIYPIQTNSELAVSLEQQELLKLFE